MKTLMSFFVFTALILGTFLSFNVWKSNQSLITFTDVEQLSSVTKIQKLSAPEGKTLVPVGAILGVNDVTSISYTYIVERDSEEAFEVIPTNVFLQKNNQTFEADTFLHFTFTIEQIDSTRSRVIVDISLNMPSSEAEYNLIDGSSISFQLLFQ